MAKDTITTVATKPPADLRSASYQKRRTALSSHTQALQREAKQRVEALQADILAVEKAFDDAVAKAAEAAERKAAECDRAIAAEFHEHTSRAVQHYIEQPNRDDAGTIRSAWMRVVARCESELGERHGAHLLTASFVEAIFEGPDQRAAIYGTDGSIRDTVEAVQSIERAVGGGPALDAALASLEGAIRAAVPFPTVTGDLRERFKIRWESASARRALLAIEEVNRTANAARQAKWAAEQQARMAERKGEKSGSFARIL